MVDVGACKQKMELGGFFKVTTDKAEGPLQAHQGIILEVQSYFHAGTIDPGKIPCCGGEIQKQFNHISHLFPGNIFILLQLVPFQRNSLALVGILFHAHTLLWNQITLPVIIILNILSFLKGFIFCQEYQSV